MIHKPTVVYGANVFAMPMVVWFVLVKVKNLYQDVRDVVQFCSETTFWGLQLSTYEIEIKEGTIVSDVCGVFPSTSFLLFSNNDSLLLS